MPSFANASVLRLAVSALLIVFLSAARADPAGELAATREMAERGNASAQLLLALAYLRGDGGLPRNPALAAGWLEKSAIGGNAYAQDRLADLYEEGLGVARLPALAAEWREKAAHRGNVDAQVKLGRAYMSGDGVGLDPEKAREWLQRADNAGNAEAAFLLARLHSQERGAETDPGGTRDALSRAASRGYPEAQWLIHRIEALSYGIDELLHERAVQVDKLAADGDAQAQYELGRQFETGAGRPQDRVQAVQWYERAAQNNHAAAMARLVRLYEAGGDGLAANPARTRYWRTRLRSAGAAESRPDASPAEPVQAVMELGADGLGFALSLAMVAAYYMFLARKVSRDPTYTIHGVNQVARRLWVISVMRNPGKDVMAVQTLRNFIMGASLMASTATLLLIGTLTLSGQADNFSRSWHALNAHGSHAAEVWIFKVLLLLVTFIVAFFAFAMCVRLANHVLFMLNVPEQNAHHELSPESVARRLNRAGNLFAIGMRAFFVAIPLAFWLFGPHFLVLATIGLVIALYRLDRSRSGAAAPDTSAEGDEGGSIPG